MKFLFREFWEELKYINLILLNYNTETAIIKSKP